MWQRGYLRADCYIEQSDIVSPPSGSFVVWRHQMWSRSSRTFILRASFSLTSRRFQEAPAITRKWILRHRSQRRIQAWFQKEQPRSAPDCEPNTQKLIFIYVCVCNINMRARGGMQPRLLEMMLVWPREKNTRTFTRVFGIHSFWSHGQIDRGLFNKKKAQWTWNVKECGV